MVVLINAHSLLNSPPAYEMVWERVRMEGRPKWVLQSCARKLSLSLITTERQLFSRLLYRNKNQHRNDQAFQRLNRVGTAILAPPGSLGAEENLH